MGKYGKQLTLDFDQPGSVSSAGGQALDPELLRELEELLAHAETTAEFIELAEKVDAETHNTQWLKQVFLAAGESVAGTADLRLLARTVRTHIKEKSFLQELFLKILEKTDTKETYVMYTQLIAIALGDGEFSKTLCRNIETIFLPKKKLEEKFKFCLVRMEMLPDQHKLKEFKKFFRKFKMNRYIKDYFFKAAKEYAEFDKMEALSAYTAYYSLSFQAGTKTTPIPVRVHKSLFSDENQYLLFFDILQALKNGEELERAQEKLVEAFSPKRKKIKLDQANIEEIKSRHSETVAQLEQILRDEGVGEGPAAAAVVRQIPVEKNGTGEPPQQAAPLTLESIFEMETKPVGTVRWSPLQEEFLTFFVNSFFKLEEGEVMAFARGKNMFKNQLINGINESFSDIHDDMLIEEADGKYILNPEHRDKIK
ncbi:MAG: hypothetical protein GY765_35635 [bacterium]|nr:hypothetical protein [bacterium]